MDTSHEYVKMCEQATEIQALAPDEYDWCEEITPSLFKNHIWLPRQDQLQEMVREKAPCERLFWRFREWWNSEVVKGEYRADDFMVNTHLNYESFEQLWLAFVMSERYQKSWNGQEWVKIPVEVAI